MLENPIYPNLPKTTEQTKGKQFAYVEHVNPKNSKDRYFTYYTNWNKALNNLPKDYGRSYCNEKILENMPCKPYLDLDQYINLNELDMDTLKEVTLEFCNDIKEIIIDVFKKRYKKDITKNEIYISDSGRVAQKKGIKMYKKSFHVTITTKETQILFKSTIDAKDFAREMRNYLIKNKFENPNIIDLTPYGKSQSMRIVKNYKDINDNIGLQPLDGDNLYNYLLTNYDLTKEHNFLNIPTRPTYKKQKTNLEDKIPSDINEIKFLLNILSNERANDFGSWINIGFCLYNIGKGKRKYLRLWKNFSKRYPKKYIRGDCEKRWNTFCLKLEKGLNIGSLRKWAVTDNKEKYCEYYKKKEFNKLKFKYENEGTKINREYLIEKKESVDKRFILDPHCRDKDLNTIKLSINNWMNKGKTLSIKSSMGTGKTTLIKSLLDRYKYEKVLWITHRRCFTNSIYGTFQNYGFVNYTKEIGCLHDNNRVIISIDSVERLFNENILPVYDLIIMDESESLLKHFNSPFLSNKRKQIFNHVYNITKFSKKIIVLDADYNNRSHEYFKSIGQVDLIINKYKTLTKQFQMTNKFNYFRKQIKKDILQGKKLCIVGLSARKLKDLYKELLKDNINVILHCADTDDELKEKIMDVNNFWSKYDIIMYSPTIDCSVDFNIEYIDKMYVLLSTQSLCPRGLIQMTGRIRKLKNPNILTYYDSKTMLNYEASKIYSYQTVEKFFEKYYVKHDFNKKYIVKNGKIETISDLSGIYERIMIYNQMESLNNNTFNFLPIFYYLCREKGYSYKNYKVGKPDKKKKNDNISEFDIDLILSALDVNNYEIQQYFKKKERNKCSIEEKYIIKKYEMKKQFGVKSLSKEFIMKFYRQENTIKNLLYLIDNLNFTKGEIKTNEEIQKIFDRNEIIKELIKDLGLKNIIDRRLIEKDEMDEIKEYIVQNNILSTDNNYVRQLFGIKLARRKKGVGLNKNNIMREMNKFLELYGLKIIKNESSRLVEHSTIKHITYYLDFINNFNDIIRYYANSNKVYDRDNLIKNIEFNDSFKELNKEVVKDMFIDGEKQPKKYNLNNSMKLILKN